MPKDVAKDTWVSVGKAEQGKHSNIPPAPPTPPTFHEAKVCTNVFCIQLVPLLKC